MTEIMKRKIILPDGAELDSLCSVNPDPVTELTGKVVRFWADVENNGISVFAENKRLSARIEKLEEALKEVLNLPVPSCWGENLWGEYQEKIRDIAQAALEKNTEKTEL